MGKEDNFSSHKVGKNGILDGDTNNIILKFVEM